MDRRSFLGRAIFALGGVIAAVTTLPIAGYLLAPLFRRGNELVDVGAVDGFRTGETKLVDFDDPSPLPWAGQTAKTALWVRRTGADAFTVFDVNCTHLGCPVLWQPEAKLFLCPCHGGVYNSDGTVAGGPPPRPLHRREWVIRGGRLLVREAPLPRSGGA